MNSRTWLNLFMLALVIVLGALILGNDEDESELLSDIDKRSVTSIEIRHRERLIELQRQGDGWRMTHPVDIAANDFRIDSVLNLINAATGISYDLEDIDLASFELDDPRTSVRFSDGVNETRFDFGTTNPINDKRYVRVGDRMHLIDDHLYPLVSSQTGTLISQQLLPDEAQIVELEIPGYLFSLEGSSWRVTPENAGFDSDDISQLMDNWVSTRSFGVHDHVERDSLGEARIRYRIADTDMTARFDVTDTDPWLVLADREMGIDYHLDISQYDRLFNPTTAAERAILDAEQGALQP